MSSPIRHLLSTSKTFLFRKPSQELGRLHRWGAHAYLRSSAWAHQMEAAASRLPVPVEASAGKPHLEVWFLTGRRFWYQTAFCAWTLSRHSGRELIVHLADDGSLTQEVEHELRYLFPNGTTHWRDECKQLFSELLPPSRYPTLHLRWHDYINLHKLTAPHLGQSGIKLVLDSDMLFFRSPDALLAWWDKPDQPCLMLDCEESYGYTRPLLENLAGVSLLPSLNVGICGLDSSSIDWDQLEYWCRSLVEGEGTSYYLEQALAAMLASRCQPIVLPRADYITFPTHQQVAQGSGVLQHYVSDSKPWYFRTAWRLASKGIIPC
jgi:hypothetical protein